jgi:protein MpaA
VSRLIAVVSGKWSWKTLIATSVMALGSLAIPMVGISADKSALENALSPEIQKQHIAKWCDETRTAIQKLNWKIDPCEDKEFGPIDWRVGGLSAEGRPLLFAEFGNPEALNTTLILSAVHGDEITPLYLGIEIAHWLKTHRAEFANSRVVIAPMVNPDGFFRSPRTRTNAHGVDVNRNFDTSDWRNAALKAWKLKYRSDPRRYPGSTPSSEPETLFQVELIRLVKPQKILSVHSPLNHLDYDGPTTSVSLQKFPTDYVRECMKLRTRLKAVSTGYFPGSLGNYAGRELGIPTLTLELPSADSRKAEQYWTSFSKGIKTMIEFQMPDYALRAVPTDESKHSGKM